MSIQVIREINVDVIKQGATKAIYAKQYDHNSRFLNARIQEDGKNIVVDSDVAVKLNVKRPDGTTNKFDGTVNPNGTVKVPMTEWMLELDGTLECDITLTQSGSEIAKLTTMNFNIYVEAAVVPNEEV